MDWIMQCILCKGDLLEDVITVTRGMNTLRDVSLKRKDGHYETFVKLNSIRLHDKCRKKYTNKRYSGELQYKDFSPTAMAPVNKKVRRMSYTFDFLNNCFICGNEASVEKEKKKQVSKRQNIRNVKSPELSEKILTMSHAIDNEICRQVHKRIITVDLLAAEAKYHLRCYNNYILNPYMFLKTKSDSPVGRPMNDEISKDMDLIYNYIDKSTDKQFTFRELFQIIGDTTLTSKTLKYRLEKKYGEKISFANQTVGNTILYFKDDEYNSLIKLWGQKKLDPESEKRKVLHNAVNILYNSILEKGYNKDYYPPNEKFLEDIDLQTPELLKYFLTELITKGKKGDLEVLERKICAINHSIISAVAPKLFLSPLQVSLSVYMHRKFGCKSIIDFLYSLGFCSSYNEAVLYQDCIILQSLPKLVQDCFIQFAFDNVDFNTNTLDGKNTLHSMAGGNYVNPYNCLEQSAPVARRKKKPTAEEISKIENINLVAYENVNSKGYSDIKILKIEIPDFKSYTISNPDFLWLFGKYISPETMCGWNGYMRKITGTYSYENTRIIPLPILNAQPSNKNTIYSVILYAIKLSKNQKQETVFISFDQQLYQKAIEIIKTCKVKEGDPEVIIRLGIFHLHMSFLASVGFIMADSGLKQVLSTIYAENAVDKILTGHAYARACRGHTLIYTALCQKIFEELEYSEVELEVLKTELKKALTEEKKFNDIEETPILKIFVEKFLKRMDEIEKRGETARLWIQYLRLIALGTLLVRSERMGNFKLQIACLKQILPYFHATGHMNYAKSAHFYVQEMIQYIDKLDSMYEESLDPNHTLSEKDIKKVKEYIQFVKKGFFTIRTGKRFFSGQFSDITIEMYIIALIKSKGGFIGRGFTDSSTMRFLLVSPFIVGLINQFEKFCGKKMTSSEQHNDTRDSRIQRDMLDVKKILEYLRTHEPFSYEKKIMSIATGVIGQNDVNCQKALEIGKTSLEALYGKTFGEFTLSRKYRVITLATKNTIKVGEQNVSVDPLQVFQRICIAKRTAKELREFLQYELAPYPMSLFLEGEMRKTTKSALYDKYETSKDVQLENCRYTIDGGMLHHRVIWKEKETFKNIIENYVSYVQKKFGFDVVVVFDGYDYNSNSTKAVERKRRSNRNLCNDIQFDLAMEATVNQEKFLSNANNKKRLIFFLIEEFNKYRSQGMSAEQAEDDADVLIANTAIDRSHNSESKKSCIVCEDIDVLVLITALVKPNDETVYFLKLAKGRNQTNRIYSSQSLDYAPFCKKNILLIHAMSGCDTTSCMFQRGKNSIFNTLSIKAEKDILLKKAIERFQNPNLSHEQVFEYGKKILLAIYKIPKKQTSIDYSRYTIFSRAIVNKKAVNLSILPPSEDAARQHFYRVYLQVQKWLSNDLIPTDWGWYSENNLLRPIRMTKKPAPDILLKMIFCNCKKTCGKACSCKKAGLQCSSSCGYCEEKNCSNLPIVNMDSEEQDEYDEPNTSITNVQEIDETNE